MGSCLALVLPALQAMVPALVPPERLVTGIALQGIGQNVAQMSGVLIGGAAIQLLGTPLLVPRAGGAPRHRRAR